MKITDEMIEAAALSDAEFDGRNFVCMGRVDRDRYMLRAKASLTAALSASPAGAVKPLEWCNGHPGTFMLVAESVLGLYMAWEINGTGVWSLGSLPGKLVDGGLEDAKSAAFADYSARIMSAIEPAGVGVETPPPSTHVAGTLTPQMIRDTAGWEQMEDELRVTLRQAANALEAAHAERDALRVVLRSAADQLALVHDDAFKQAAGYGLVTSDGREFSCYQLNVCQTAAGRARAALASTEGSEE